MYVFFANIFQTCMLLVIIGVFFKGYKYFRKAF